MLLARARLPRGIPAASLKPCRRASTCAPPSPSSAGNTRGLIEATPRTPRSRWRPRLPRGIPAASLKRVARQPDHGGSRRLPRGIPAASLKPLGARRRRPPVPGLPRGIPAASLKRWRWRRRTQRRGPSSAGNTRGLIEACESGDRRGQAWGLPRGIPAASLKLEMLLTIAGDNIVFRGEYPRPH